MSGKGTKHAFIWVNMRFKRGLAILLAAVLTAMWLMPTYSLASADSKSADHGGSHYSGSGDHGDDDGHHDHDDDDDDGDHDDEDDGDDDSHDHDDDGDDSDNDGDENNEDGHDNDTGRGHDEHGNGNGYGHDDNDDDEDGDDDSGEHNDDDSDNDDDGDDGSDDDGDDHNDDDDGSDDDSGGEDDGHPGDDGGDSTTTPEFTPPALLPPTALPSTFDLSVSKTDDVDPAHVGDTVTYTITVKNKGDQPLTSLVLRDTLAGGMAFKGSNVSGLEKSGGVLTWSMSTLAAGKTQTFRVSLIAKKAGDWLNTVTITAKELPTARQAGESTRVLARLAAAPATSDADPASATGGTLPFTGFETLTWFLTAFLFLLAGTALEVRTRKSGFLIAFAPRRPNAGRRCRADRTSLK